MTPLPERSPMDPTAAEIALADARQERKRLESKGRRPTRLAKELNCRANWDSVEIALALRLLAEARKSPQ